MWFSLQIAALVNPAAVDPLNQKRFHNSEMDMGMLSFLFSLELIWIF